MRTKDHPHQNELPAQKSSSVKGCSPAGTLFFTQSLHLDSSSQKTKISSSFSSSPPYSGFLLSFLRHLFMFLLPLVLAAHSSFILFFNFQRNLGILTPKGKELAGWGERTEVQDTVLGFEPQQLTLSAAFSQRTCVHQPGEGGRCSGPFSPGGDTHLNCTTGLKRLPYCRHSTTKLTGSFEFQRSDPASVQNSDLFVREET